MKNIIFLLMFVSFSAQAIELIKSIPGRYNAGPRTPEQQESIIKLINLYKTAGEYKKGMLGFVEYSPAIWYSLDRDLRIQGGNVSTTQYLGHWPLGTSELCDVGKGCKSAWWQGRWREEELLEPSTIARLDDLYDSLVFKGSYAADGYRQTLDSMGCMQHSPLRYGDIEGDGENELVVMLAQRYSIDWIISSPQEKKTIFAVKLNVNDVIAHSDIPQNLIPSYNGAKVYQYWMQSEKERGKPLYHPALKSFAKLYFGDFDEDGSFDILVWRKAYESRLVSDSIAGFEIKSELFGHYKRIDDEYRLQTTDTATIQTWLSEKNLTWQKGYPSKSECPGQQGQLIPEMHDPLLNDPEVMQ